LGFEPAEKIKKQRSRDGLREASRGGDGTAWAEVAKEKMRGVEIPPTIIQTCRAYDPLIDPDSPWTERAGAAKMIERTRKDRR